MDGTALAGSHPSNALLRALSTDDRTLLQPHLEPVVLKFRAHLQRANRPVRDIYFPESGLASVVAIGAGRRAQAEVAVLGWEGMTGIPVILGTDRSPCDIFMQIEGRGQRISSDNLRGCLDQSPTLLRCLLRFTQAFITQSAYTALANAKGKIDERLGRWLLMAHDRTEGDKLSLTHEFLALMLGIRRSGVTVALGNLERRATINMRRGSITVLDRAGLEAAANGLYGVPETELRRLFGQPFAYEHRTNGSTSAIGVAAEHQGPRD
ncbi:MAG TPA: Crp/Fnr family transcriptional regulator [Nitrospiraceae bacterium]|nr:Crp/Fnr family transcriptional regulator [Nitrospiraceae bacterium]